MTWTLFDYGVGNLHSLRKALDHCGAKTRITTDPQDLDDASVAVLPGVGAFGHVMDALGAGADIVRARHAARRPVLGICIGHQILYERSQETAGTPGIGVFKGDVRALPHDHQKVPHMGWNTLATRDPRLAAAGHVYYVHSYAAPPGDDTVATTDYGMTFAAADHAHNTWGLQFHPEKSGPVGLSILRAIVADLEGA